MVQVNITRVNLTVAGQPVTVQVQEPAGNLWQVRGDEELEEFGYKSRTIAPDWSGVGLQTPSVFRFSPEPIAKPGDYRVDVSAWAGVFTGLQGETDLDDPRTRYLVADWTALFNRTGWPKLQYLTMSRNYLRGEQAGDYLKFETLRVDQVGLAAGMTYLSHPHFIHRFDVVGWSRAYEKTYHTWTTPQGFLYWPLVTREGYGYIPIRYVRKV